MSRQRRQPERRDAHANAAAVVGLLTAGRGRRRIVDTPGTALIALIALATLCHGPASQAAERQPLADIERAAEAFVAARAAGADAVAAPLDRRLNLARCNRRLEPFLRPGATLTNRTIVGVRCSGSRPWKVYVPVSIAVHEDVLVLTRNLPRGHLLAAGDLETQRRDVSRLAAGYITESAGVVGQRLKHSLRAGSIVTSATLEARVLVRRGQTVTLSAHNDSIAIRVAGKALTDGALNQRIRVQNMASGRIVEGLVRSAEVVEVLVQ